MQGASAFMSVYRIVILLAYKGNAEVGCCPVLPYLCSGEVVLLYTCLFVYNFDLSLTELKVWYVFWLNFYHHGTLTETWLMLNIETLYIICFSCDTVEPCSGQSTVLLVYQVLSQPRQQVFSGEEWSATNQVQVAMGCQLAEEKGRYHS